MKKSLLSKLLAGVMSLGMISGSGSIQSVCAMDVEYEEEEEDQIADYEEEVTTLSQKNKSTSGVSRASRAVCVGLDLFPCVGNTYVHSVFGTPVETFTSLSSWIIAYGAFNFGEDLVLSEEDKKNIDDVKTKMANQGVTDEKHMKIDANGNIVKKSDEQIVVTKDEFDPVKSALHKVDWVKYGIPLAVYFGWPLYDAVQLVRGQ